MRWYHLPGNVYYSDRLYLKTALVWCGIQKLFWCGIQCATASWCVIFHGSQDRTYMLQNTTSEVMWSCNVTTKLSTRGRSANRQCFERNAWCTRAQLRYFVTHIYATSFGRGWAAVMQTVGTKYPISNFNISASTSFPHYYYLRMYDYTPMIFTVPMLGSEVANSKTEIHI